MKLQNEENSDINKRFQHPQRTESTQEPNLTNPSDIVYENDNLKLIVEKGSFKRQKSFKLQDHHFYLKIIPKENNGLPQISDILDFLHAGFIHILDTLKQFYEPGI